MAFLDQFKAKASSISKAASDKTNEMIEVTKLNKKISDSQHAITENYLAIGKLVFEKYTNGSSLDEDVASNCKTISELQEEIKKLQEQINGVKGGETCSNCGSMVAKDAKFCPKCGNKMEVAAEVLEESSVEVVDDSSNTAE